MAGSGPLNRTRLTELFEELDKELRHHPGRVVMYIAGGARMALGWKETRTTRDVDGVIREGHGAAVKAIAAVGRRHGLTDSWMNEEMTAGLPQGSDPGETTLFHGNSLTVKGASASWMLAMKTAAGRAVDVADARTLIEHLEIGTTREVRELVTRLYPDMSDRKLTRVDGTLDKLADAIDTLVNNHRSKEREDAREATPTHPTARLHPQAKIHPSAEIGAGTIIEAHAEIQEHVKVGDHTVVRTGTLLREGAEVGSGCDIAASYLGLRTKVGDGVRMDANSSVGDRCTISNRVHLEIAARVGHDAAVGRETTLGPRTYVHARANIGAGVTTDRDVRIGQRVRVGDGTSFAAEARVAPNAEIGARTSVGEKAGIGFDAGISVMPPSVIGNDCAIGDEAVLDADTGMGDGCTLEANATLEYRAHMEAGSTVCAGSKVRPDATIPEGETVPPSTLVKADGTQLPRHVDIDDYNFRDNDDDREIRDHADDEPHRVAEAPPAAASPAADQVWIVIDINGEPYPKHGYFESLKECRDHITNKIDSADDRMYDRDSMFEAMPVKRAGNDKDTDNAAIWIVKTDRFLTARHGFFRSRERAAHNREPDETIARVQPARQHERSRDNQFRNNIHPDDEPHTQPENPPRGPTPAAGASGRREGPEIPGPSR